MSNSAMQYLRLIGFLLVAAPVAAQHKGDIPSEGKKEAVEKVQHPPGIGKKLPQLGETLKTRRGQVTGETKPNPDAPPAAERKPDPAPAAETKPDPSEALRFGSAGKRDPFRPYTLTARSKIQRRENLSPLERYELGQLKLVGVIWDPKAPTAMVEDSAGLGYVVKVGTPIGANEGTVKTIKPNGITIEEFYMDFYGAKKRREVHMRIVPESAP